VPANIPGEMEGACTFAVRSGRQLPQASLMMAQLVGSHAFEAGRRIVQRSRALGPDSVRLTGRQLDCIRLIGRGKTDWEIATILDIGQTTVKDYIDDARERYGVTKRVQLVLRAVHDGHLSLADLVE
jgi:LuxR family quorum-sensing system transcriptional regulator CciR